MRNARVILPLILSAAYGAAQAQVAYSSINATYSMNPGSGTIKWVVVQNIPPGTIDFIQNAPAFKVGDSTSFSTGASSITYNVTSANPITSVDLLLQGDVEDFGRIAFTEGVTSGSNNLGSLSGTILGGSYSGGLNGAFTKVFHLNFSQGATSFAVSQTMASDINGQNLPSTSLALVALVEQNFAPVPEPASLAALGIGALAMLRRRRRSE